MAHMWRLKQQDDVPVLMWTWVSRCRLELRDPTLMERREKEDDQHDSGLPCTNGWGLREKESWLGDGLGDVWVVAAHPVAMRVDEVMKVALRLVDVNGTTSVQSLGTTSHVAEKSWWSGEAHRRR